MIPNAVKLLLLVILALYGFGANAQPADNTNPNTCTSVSNPTVTATIPSSDDEEDLVVDDDEAASGDGAGGGDSRGDPREGSTNSQLSGRVDTGDTQEDSGDISGNAGGNSNSATGRAGDVCGDAASSELAVGADGSARWSPRVELPEEWTTTIERRATSTSEHYKPDILTYAQYREILYHMAYRCVQKGWDFAKFNIPDIITIQKSNKVWPPIIRGVKKGDHSGVYAYVAKRFGKKSRGSTTVRPTPRSSATTDNVDRLREDMQPAHVKWVDFTQSSPEAWARIASLAEGVDSPSWYSTRLARKNGYSRAEFKRVAFKSGNGGHEEAMRAVKFSARRVSVDGVDLSNLEQHVLRGIMAHPKVLWADTALMAEAVAKRKIMLQVRGMRNEMRRSAEREASMRSGYEAQAESQRQRIEELERRLEEESRKRSRDEDWARNHNVRPNKRRRVEERRGLGVINGGRDSEGDAPVDIDLAVSDDDDGGNGTGSACVHEVCRTLHTLIPMHGMHRELATNT